MTICRPTVTDNFTSLPNFLFGYGRHNLAFKPRDSAILHYLFSKPAGWRVVAQDIAIATNLSINTVYAGLRVLRHHGFASYQRDKSGRTQWSVSLPDTPATPAMKPHTKKPREEFCDDLVNNNSLQNIQKTTTAIVAVALEPIQEQPKTDITSTTTLEHDELLIELPDIFDAKQKIVVKNAFKKSGIDSLTLRYVILALKTALNSQNIRSPMAYLNALLNRAKMGDFSSNNLGSHKPLISRADSIKTLFKNNGDKIRYELSQFGYISVKELGVVHFSEVNAMGLLNEEWVKIHAEFRIKELEAKSQKMNSQAPQIKQSVSDNTKRLNNAEFEALRDAKVRAAMALLDS